MSTTALVIDTSYLLELFTVPDYFDAAFAKAVKQRFRQSINAGARFFVPFPIIFELANHIAHVRDRGARKQLADTLVKTVRSCIENATPWIITPASEDILYDLSELLRPRTGSTSGPELERSRATSPTPSPNSWSEGAPSRATPAMPPRP